MLSCNDRPVQLHDYDWLFHLIATANELVIMHKITDFQILLRLYESFAHLDVCIHSQT